MQISPTIFAEYVVRAGEENVLSVPADNEWVGVRTNGVIHRVIGKGGTSDLEIEVTVQLISTGHAVEIKSPVVIGILDASSKGTLIAVQTG